MSHTTSRTPRARPEISLAVEPSVDRWGVGGDERGTWPVSHVSHSFSRLTHVTDTATSSRRSWCTSPSRQQPSTAQHRILHLQPSPSSQLHHSCVRHAAVYMLACAREARNCLIPVFSAALLVLVYVCSHEVRLRGNALTLSDPLLLSRLFHHDKEDLASNTPCRLFMSHDRSRYETCATPSIQQLVCIMMICDFPMQAGHAVSCVAVGFRLKSVCALGIRLYPLPPGLAPATPTPSFVGVTRCSLREKVVENMVLRHSPQAPVLNASDAGRLVMAQIISASDSRTTEETRVLEQLQWSSLAVEQGLVLLGGYMGTSVVQALALMAVWSRLSVTAGWMSRGGYP